MSDIQRALAEARSRGGGLVTYLMGGDPEMRRSREYLIAAAEGGANVLEVGIPFSDPVADGPTIQAAGLRALGAGTKPLEVVRMAGSVARETATPVALMTYYNPILAPGEERFVEAAAASGVSGFIVPDLPAEESGPFREICAAQGLDLILLATPATGPARMERIASLSTGFLYLVSRYGVTGARQKLEEELAALIQSAKGAARELPVAVGFGISGAAQVRRVIDLGADAAVVGSALVDLVAQGLPAPRVKEFVAGLKVP